MAVLAKFNRWTSRTKLCAPPRVIYLLTQEQLKIWQAEYKKKKVCRKKNNKIMGHSPPWVKSPIYKCAQGRIWNAIIHFIGCLFLSTFISTPSVPIPRVRIQCETLTPGIDTFVRMVASQAALLEFTSTTALSFWTILVVTSGLITSKTTLQVQGLEVWTPLQVGEDETRADTAQTITIQIVETFQGNFRM